MVNISSQDRRINGLYISNADIRSAKNAKLELAVSINDKGKGVKTITLKPLSCCFVYILHNVGQKVDVIYNVGTNSVVCVMEHDKNFVEVD